MTAHEHSPVEKRLLARRMRHLISEAVEALYSEQFDAMDALVVSFSEGKVGSHLLRAYIAISFAARLSGPLSDADVEGAVWQLLALESHVNRAKFDEVLDVYEKLAGLHWQRRQIAILSGKLARQRDELSYEGMIYDIEREMSGPATAEQRAKIRELADKASHLNAQMKQIELKALKEQDPEGYQEMKEEIEARKLQQEVDSHEYLKLKFQLDEVEGLLDEKLRRLLSSEAAKGGGGRIGDETRSISDQFEGRPDGEREVKPESRPSARRGPVAKFILFLVALATVVCGSIGAVWLGLLGQWRMLLFGFFGFVSSVGMPHVWLFATLLVTTPLTVVFHKYTSFSRPIAAIWTLFSVLCEGVLVACWTALVFWYLLSDAEKAAFAPALVWAYSITMAPLTYKAIRYPGLAFGGVWSLGLATTTYLALVVFRIAGVGETGGMAAAIVLLWSFLLTGYLMSISVDNSSSAETSEAPSEASLDPIPSSASPHRTRRGGRVSGLRAAIRWILALPAGVLGAAIVAFPVHWFVMVNFTGMFGEPLIEIGDPEELRWIELLLQALFGPLAFVYCAARTVPRYNRLVAVLLTVAIVLALPLFNHWWNSEVIARGHGVLFERGVLRTLAGVVGCGGAIWLVHRHGPFMLGGQ